ncbi:unnamed protein product [Aphanomyces euteiches]|uniref:Uncharacterized protein n=1 Tax=Aphanomyces euteiches TaxID=100861 RepID=A0A6G0WM93_9STRA|nr:hypothetical protein Ae201684_013822 [Aphanomyces euteiches]KAH9113963.1 hypothetical protein AeMF1_011919 [Aphanomyces euteiches]KAH9155521.1 hypothetical protein AeRB84_002510 [Aphanomyces euteiches]KAH9158767.1 hypothetical protein LEN26_002739 [Aphanomyces euteiches]KAH9188464.1 hypothetical protein AeNC1_009560 [Aphanomyces euteiches]
MNRTGMQLAAIERRLNRMERDAPENDQALLAIVADCRRKLRDFQNQYQLLLTSELKIQSPPTTDFQTRLAEWLNDDTILRNNDEEDPEFSTLDGFLLVEDVDMLAQFVHDVAQTKTRRSSTSFIKTPSATNVCLDQPTLVN